MSENNIENEPSELELPVEGESSEVESSEETTPTEQAQEIKKLKKLLLKVDGKEIEEELPFEIDEAHAAYFREQLQLAKAAQNRMREASSLKKEKEQTNLSMQAFVQALKDDPASILSHPNIGVDLKEFATRIMNQQLEEDVKSPEQKELEKLQKEKEEYAKKLEQLQSQKDAEERARLQNIIANQITDEITSAITEFSLPNDEMVVSRFLEAYKLANSKGINLSAKEVAPIIKKQMYEEAKRYVQMFDEDTLEDFIGKDRVSSVHKRMLGKLKSQTPPTLTDVKDTGTANYEKLFDKSKKERVTGRDYFRELAKKYK
jgi:hypothetical protein